LVWIGEEILNEKRIQDVIELEKQADAIYAQAVAEAAQIPVEAESESEQYLEKNRMEAHVEARQVTENAKAEEECERIISQSNEKMQRTETIARGNMVRAISYVLNRVVGRE
jgi:vacuolar-type H+-ATPase subunit H